MGEHTKNGIQFYTDNFSHQQSIMGVNTITFECFRDSIDYYDVIDSYYKVKKITPKNSKVCTVYAEHVIYDLKDIVVKQSGTQEVVFELYGCELSTLIGESGIITTALSTYGFTIDKTKIGSTQIYRDISFDSDNYLSAINKICETYGIEYYAEGMTIYFCFEAGKETEVYQVLEGSNVEKIDKQEDISELCTSVIPLGSNEGLPFSYGYKNLRPTKYYYQSKNHGDINPSGVPLNLRIKVIDYQTGGTYIQYSTNGGTTWSGDLNFTNTYQNEYECTTIISGNSNDIRFRFTGKESIYTVLIKDNSSVYSDNTVYYIKEKIHLGTRISNPATNLTYIIDLSQYKFTSENPQLSISTTSPYGIKERVIVFNDIKPELYKGVVKYVHFNADLSGYIKVKESDLLNLINYRQLQEQESTLMFTDNYYFTEISKLKITEINGDTIYFAPLSSEEYAKIKDKTGAFRLRVDTDISSELLQTTWTIENYVYAEQLEEASYKLIMEANRYLAEYSKPRITYNINFLFAKTDFLKVGQTLKISRNASAKINSFTVTNAGGLSYKLYIDSDTYNFYNASTILNLSVNKLITVELENTSTVKKTGLFIININGAEMLRVGYSLPAGEKLYDYIYNGDFARIESFDYSESKQGYTSLKLSTKIKKIPSISVQKQIETDKKIKEIITEVTDLRKNYKATRDSFNLLKQNNFFGSDEEYHVIGSNDRDYALLGCNFTTDTNLVRWTNGQLNLDGLYYNVPAGVEEYTEPALKYISIRLRPNDFTSASMYFSDTKLSGPMGEYTYYSLGMVRYNMDDFPELAFGFGKTYINGGDIVTQTITADLLNVSQLSAITANVGTLTAGVLQNNKTKIDLTNDIITVNEDTVKIGKGALSDNSDGISVKGKIEIKDIAGSKSILSGAGLRQIYSITAIDQIDASYGLSIPVNIPENTVDGTSFGVARVIITVEPFRSFAKAASTGGGSTDVELNLNLQITANPVWESNPFSTTIPKDLLQTQSVNVAPSSISGSISDSGSHSHTASTSIASDGSHSHTFSGSDSVSMSHSVEIATDTALSGGYAHSHYGTGITDTVTELVTISGNTSSSITHSHTATTSISSDGSHSHTFSNIPHTHKADIPLHYHYLPNLSHTHVINTTGSTGGVDLPNHAHNLDFGIFQSSAIATVTVKKGSTVIGTIKTNNSGDFKDISVVNGDQINITSDNLARVKVFIFVEYMLKI